MLAYKSDIKLKASEVQLLLLQFNNSFDPHLQDKIDFSSYSDKLSTNALFIVASDDSIVGFIAYYVNERSHFLYVPLIAVQTQYQRRRIGHNMMALLKRSLSKSIKNIYLEVAKSNHTAQEFYSREGFILA